RAMNESRHVSSTTALAVSPPLPLPEKLADAANDALRVPRLTVPPAKAAAVCRFGGIASSNNSTVEKKSTLAPVCCTTPVSEMLSMQWSDAHALAPACNEMLYRAVLKAGVRTARNSQTQRTKRKIVRFAGIFASDSCKSFISLVLVL